MLTTLRPLCVLSIRRPPCTPCSIFIPLAVWMERTLPSLRNVALPPLFRATVLLPAGLCRLAAPAPPRLLALFAPARLLAFAPPRLLALFAPARLLAFAPPRLLALFAPARLLAFAPPRLLAFAPPRLLAFAPPRLLPLFAPVCPARLALAPPGPRLFAFAGPRLLGLAPPGPRLGELPPGR